MPPGPGEGLGGALRVRREQLGWSQARLARAAGVSRTVVNEMENGRRSPSLGSYDKLRRALGLDLAGSLALLPVQAPASTSEQLLSTLGAMLVTTGRVELADLSAALDLDTTRVRAAVAQLAGRLAAVGIAAVDDGVRVELTVLTFAADAVGTVRSLEAARALTPEALMVLVIVGHLGEATRRDVEARRGADSTGVLDRLVARDLLVHRTDQGSAGRPNAYRLTTRALTLVGHATLESFQAWCRQQVTAAGPDADPAADRSAEAVPPTGPHATLRTPEHGEAVGGDKAQEPAPPEDAASAPCGRDGG